MTVHTADWWAAPRQETAGNWVANYQRSLDSPQRDVLTTIIGELAPETLIEVGCHCGPNLVRLAMDHPALKMIGIDISREAIEAGRQWIRSLEHEDRIQLNVGEARASLSNLSTNTADVVVSSYCLAYFSPEDLGGMLYEIGRVASAHAVLVEPIRTDTYQGRQSSGGYQEWAHDYVEAAQWVGTLRGWNAKIYTIDPPVDHLNGAVVFSASSA